jgi:pimeloyl-ACP methyl ester carboxylesterase
MANPAFGINTYLPKLAVFIYSKDEASTLRSIVMNLLKCLRGLIQGFGVYMLVLIAVSSWPGVSNAAATAVKPAKVVLLLHGKASNLSTWNKLVDNRAGFDKRCKNTNAAKFPTVKLTPNSEGVYCMRFTFGGLDRISTAPKGLGDSTCSQAGGCSGDYSTFDTLGEEIATAIDRIKTRLGSDAEIVLLGHSRGGVAARAFLQSDSPVKSNVVGLITTGTPHAGTPLGRYYSYMNKNCLPESNYDSVFDLSDCAEDWRFTNLILKKAGDINLKAPTFDFLSDSSSAIKELNANVSKLPAIKYTQLAYDNLKFGCLGGSLINSERNCGFDIFSTVGGPSNSGLNAVLNGRKRSTLTGDGLVSYVSQRMNSLAGWVQPIKNYRKVQRVHASEPKQITDLSRALTNMYKRLKWVK